MRHVVNGGHLVTDKLTHSCLFQFKSEHVSPEGFVSGYVMNIIPVITIILWLISHRIIHNKSLLSDFANTESQDILHYWHKCFPGITNLRSYYLTSVTINGDTFPRGGPGHIYDDMFVNYGVCYIRAVLFTKKKRYLYFLGFTNLCAVCHPLRDQGWYSNANQGVGQKLLTSLPFWFVVFDQRLNVAHERIAYWP